MVPCPWAGTSATCDRATSTVSAMRWLVSTLPATTAEGQRAFTRQPSGATTLMGANVPALLTGTSLARSTCMAKDVPVRSEEHTSELQSRQYLVCRLLLEKKKSVRK